MGERGRRRRFMLSWRGCGGERMKGGRTLTPTLSSPEATLRPEYRERRKSGLGTAGEGDGVGFMRDRSGGGLLV
jgi:hypothetical protein